MSSLNDLLPDFPRTRHLGSRKGEDFVARDEEAARIFTCDKVWVEEKVDGANVGMILHDGHPVIRNRNHILNKGFVNRRTAAKMQFASIYNWFYENIDRFRTLYDVLGFEATVYGEWLYALHGIRYDQLPNYFVAYDIFDPERQQFVHTGWVRDCFQEAGFAMTPLLHQGKVESWEQLAAFCQQDSEFSSTDKREGVYVKVCDQHHVTDRFKMVREDFIQGCHWSDREIRRNRLHVKRQGAHSTNPEPDH